MRRQYAYFSELPARAVFACNGNQCRKQSSRTARLIEYGKTFYFAQLELCTVGLHSRLHAGYFERGAI